MRNLTSSLLLAISGFVHGQDFAPAAIAATGEISYNGTVTENGNSEPYSGALPLEAGTFTYIRTGTTTGTLSYSIGDSSLNGTRESGTLQLTFTSPIIGTFTGSASYTESSGGTSQSGTFTSSGTFAFDGAAKFPLLGLSDNFNDNVRDLAKWGTEDFTPDPPAVLTEKNQRLEYTCPDTRSTISFRSWIATPTLYSANWEAIVDTSVIPSGLPGITGFGIDIIRADDADKFIFIEHQDNAFLSGMSTGGNETAFNPSHHSAIRVSYDSSTRIIRCDYDEDGPVKGYAWTNLSAFSVGTTSQPGTTFWENWGMSASQPFQVSLYGYSSDRIVTSGEASADNFRIGSPPASTGTALGDWKVLHFGDTVVADSDDSDGDSVKNLIEYAVGLDPNVPEIPKVRPGISLSGLPYLQGPVTGTPATSTLEFIRRKSSSNPGITYTPQFSTDLSGSGAAGWQPATATATVTSIDSIWERVVVPDHLPPGQSRRFARLLVTENP
ncbi:MAG: hypothetical protein EOP87_01155 [Verrucomicrobiaceae bacterium]|nr:MAG: hypothetical protein EOP87_01155 [Verrucomicrobiaceae bacterium]